MDLACMNTCQFSNYQATIATLILTYGIGKEICKKENNCRATEVNLASGNQRKNGPRIKHETIVQQLPQTHTRLAPYCCNYDSHN